MKWDEGLERLDAIAAAAATANVGVVRVEDRGFFAEVRRDVRPVPGIAAPAGLPAAEVPAVNGHASSNGVAEHPAVLLRSDVVGIVRLAKPVVAIGAAVDAERELAYVESLGIRTPVRAGDDGVVAEILIEDGQAVDFGQALFAVRPEA
jgi:acetyl-CoA carboxylase biotin carboxyl carrier protein